MRASAYWLHFGPQKTDCCGVVLATWNEEEREGELGGAWEEEETGRMQDRKLYTDPYARNQST